VVSLVALRLLLALCILFRMRYPEPMTWNAAANETIREMIRLNAVSSTLPSLRTFYDEMSSSINKEPDLDGVIIAAMWRTFGSRCQASSALLTGQSLLWQTVSDTVISKQRDYGKENITRFGQLGLLVRVHDKLARLEHLTATGKTPSNESLADTVLDLVGYSILGAMLGRKQFALCLV
jgi:hypothetical protein